MASLVASCSRVCGWNNNNSSTTWLPAPDDETTWGNKSNPQSCRCWCWKLFVVWRCLWGRGGALLCKFMSVCLIVCGCMNMYLHNCACVRVRCISVCVNVCQSCGPVAMRNPAGRKSERIHPGSQGPGATQVPGVGMKGCSADVTRWGSVA